ncbi:MAG: site-2 protease family protein [Terriglobia bacterium]
MRDKLVKIHIRFNLGWVVAILLLVYALTSQFAAEFPHWGRIAHWSVGVSASLLFLGSILFHELSHVLVAKALKLPAPKLSLLSFRMASQLMADVRKPIHEFLIAGAGPLSSIGLALLFWMGWVLTKSYSELFGALAEWLAEMNLILAIFNLVPGFPLDGGRILRAVLWMATGSLTRATQWTSRIGKAAAILFFGATLVLVLFEQMVFALWMGLIGWFVWVSSRQMDQLGRIRTSLEGLTAEDLMVRDCPRVSSRLSLKSFKENILSHLQQDTVLVLEGDLLQGIVTPYVLGNYPQDKWDNSLVTDVMIPVTKLRWVRPELDILRILERMDREDIHHVPVVSRGSLLGVLGRHEIYSRLRSQFQEVPS